MFNEEVKSRLGNHLVSPYVLDSAGASMVYESNEDLPDEYFDHLEFPISKFWYKYFSEKINTLPPEKYGNALDICAGTGTVSLNLMKKEFFKRCEAIDISEAAIQILKERIHSNHIKNLTAECSNIMKTHYPDNNFDCIFGNSFLHHLPDNKSFLSEMYRIVKTGGTICFTSEPTNSASGLEFFFMGNALKLLQFFRIKPKPNKNDAALSDIWLYDKETLIRMLREVGFTSIIVKGFGFLTPLLNGPSTILFRKISKKSMQPDWWWNMVTTLDKLLFFWLPTSAYSHFTICAKKKNTL